MKRLVPLTLALAISFLGASCATHGNANAKRGGVIGALLGGVAGAAIGENKGRELEGAAIGAAAGALGGAAMGSAEDDRSQNTNTRGYYPQPQQQGGYYPQTGSGPYRPVNRY